jgi:predicted nucleotidyltransferase component of viral defense system
MITRSQVRTVATRSRFRPEPVEKVLRLIEILQRLDRHEVTRSAWVLKGGTALNLFHLDAPRLSIDVDINFVGVEDVQALPQARESFERALVSCCERAGCVVKRAPEEHAGGKFRLRFASVLGGTQNLELDVSYVARLPLLSVERRVMSSSILGEDCEAPCLAFEEIAAGKYVALLSRLAARDFYDATSLLRVAPDLPDRPGFRLAFVCQVAASRADFRDLKTVARMPDVVEVRQKLFPLLRVDPDVPGLDPEGLAKDMHRRLGPAIRRVLKWSKKERAFLDRFLDSAEIEPRLLTEDPGLGERIRKQSMLLWKRQHLRKRSGK